MEVTEPARSTGALALPGQHHLQVRPAKCGRCSLPVSGGHLKGHELWHEKVSELEALSPGPAVFGLVPPESGAYTGHSYRIWPADG